MPMNNAQRAEHVRNFRGGATPTNTEAARSISKSFTRMARQVRSGLKTFNNRFQNLPGANAAAKRTAFFDAISAETDGGLILHDFGTLLDCLLDVANDYRQPEDDALVNPFTDADVTAYLP